MTTQKLTFEADYDSDEFKASNTIPFTLRNRVFTIARLTMQELQDDAAEAVENPSRTTTIEDWFKRRLSASDFAEFWAMVNTEGNPVRPKTLNEIIVAVNAELQGVGDDEETPKD